MKNRGKSVTDAAMNMNTGSTGTSLKAKGATIVSLIVKHVTGTHATHVTEIQVSRNGTDWVSTNHNITGVGVLDAVLCLGNQYRSKVKTVEGAASTCDVTLIIR